MNQIHWRSLQSKSELEWKSKEKIIIGSKKFDYELTYAEIVARDTSDKAVVNKKDSKEEGKWTLVQRKKTSSYMISLKE